MKGMKTGGRKKGTPNKENPLKGFIRAHSLSYFEPKNVKFNGKVTIMSDFELDMAELAPDDRVNAELRLLEFHTPKMKAVDVDMSAKINVRTIEDKLSALCGEDADEDDDEDDCPHTSSSITSTFRPDNSQFSLIVLATRPRWIGRYFYTQT